MAVIEFSVSDLENLVGKKLTKEEMTEKIPMMGFPLEKLCDGRAFFEVFPNRPDMLSVEGFARSVRSFMDIGEIPKYKFKKGKIKVVVEKSVGQVRPFIAASAVRNVKLTDELLVSLMQVQEKLHDTLGRRRAKVAIGIHDLDKVKPPFTYKAISPDEISFVPLDMEKKMNLIEICDAHPKGIKYAHLLKNYPNWPIIIDKKGDVLSFPPIINGDLTRVTENTKNIFIDVTGTDKKAVNQAINILTALFHERKCNVESVTVADGKPFQTPDTTPAKMNLDLNYASKLLGMKISQSDAKKFLGKMGIEFSGKASIPYYRTDIMHPIDLVEEMAIAAGYQNFPPEIPKVATISLRNPKIEFCDSIASIMVGMGFQEVVSMILTNEDDEFTKMNRPVEETCSTANPLTVECTLARRNVIPSLLRILSQNKNKEYPQKIFESGLVLIPDNSEETGARTMIKIASAISDVKSSYEDISPVLDSFMRSLGIEYKLKKADHPSFILGRAAWIDVSGKPIGVIGEINPEVLEKWKIEKPVCAFELDVNDLMKIISRL